MILRPKVKDFFAELPKILASADDVQILNSTPQYRQSLLSLIKNAQQRIYITTLYLQDDEAGQEILTALYEAKQKNPKLDVKVFVDFLRAQRGLMGHAKSVGNVRLYREMNEKYQHSIDIQGVPVKSKEFLGVLHLKGFVIDDTLLYSGASLNNVYLQKFEKYRCDRYHVIKSQELTNSFVIFLQNNFVKNDAVKSLVKENILGIKQLKSAIRRLKLKLRRAEYFVKNPIDSSDNKGIYLTPLLGFGGRKNQLNQTIFQLIKQTKQEIVIFTPYFNFPAKVHSAVRQQLKQGKKVTILVGDKTANDFYIAEDQPFNKIGILPYIYETSLRRFVKKHQKFIDQNLLSINLWLDPGNSFHLKGISSDQSKYLITGHNINPRAWRLDIENGVLIQDPQKQLVDKFDRELENIMQHCSKIDHFDQIETVDQYRPEASKLLKSVKRAKLDSILNRLL